jgi:signal transduction histidine kinase
VLDIKMPGMNGVEVLERLKAIDPSIEVIMLTAYETIDTIRQALRLGACDYLNKPFDLNTMRAAVANAMERRSLSEEIRSNNQRLDHLQSELQNQRLQEEIVRTRGEIYASVIHDINGPLTVISGFIQIINQRIEDANRLEGEDLDLVKDRLRRISRQVANCAEISHRYLSFMRQQATESPRISLNQILADLQELLQVHPSARNNELLIEPLIEDATLQINGTDLMQMLLNLTINALQCTPNPHKVRIHGSLLHDPLDIAGLHQPPADTVLNQDHFQNTVPLVALTVEDDGPGIPQEVLPRIFEPYFTTKPPSHGTGLGLAIVQRLVKESDSLLHLHTKSGKGSAFTLYLPAWATTSTR